MESISVAFLEADAFFLRELRDSDLAGNWYQWLNDESVTRFQDKKIFPNTLAKQTSYYNSLQNSETDVVLAIIDKTSGIHVGNVGLHRINWIHRSAEIGIIIGEKDYWGRGYGKIAWNLMTGYGFNTLNLHRISAIIMAGNTGSIKCAEFSGFQKTGTIQEAFYKDGKYLDAHYFNILKKQYEATR